MFKPKSKYKVKSNFCNPEKKKTGGSSIWKKQSFGGALLKDGLMWRINND